MRPLSLSIVVVALVAAAAAGGYWFATWRMSGSHTSAPPGAGADTASGATHEVDGVVQDRTGKRVLYWHDPMYPQHKFQKPGKSPFMDMQLMPVYAGSGGEDGSISISPRVVQNLGIRTATAEMGRMEQKFEAVGTVEYNERGVVLVQPRTGGFVERIFARTPLDPVRKGAPLVELLVPDWAAAQEEYLFLLARATPELRDLVAASRQRLMLAGMSEAQIALVERDRTPHPRITIVSPIDGVIAELGAREGMTVMAGMTLYRLVDLSSVWVNAEVPETQATWLRPGNAVNARVAAWPEQTFRGRVSTILPELNQASRTLRARIELANPGGRLKPGMFASLGFVTGQGEPLPVVPSEAVIQTGTRSVVLVAEGAGKFRPVEVEVGREMDGRTEIRKGLKSGERVVVSGQFLVDSEASLKATLGRLEARADAPALTADGLHPGRGKVLEVDAEAGRVELDHGPMPSIQWPAMKMGFRVADRKALAGLKPGQSVEFDMRGEPDKEGDYVIERIRPAK